jgi:hypothetical protein
VELGYQPAVAWRLRAAVEGGEEQLSAANPPGALAVRNGLYLQPRLSAEWNSLSSAGLAARGALAEASIAWRHRAWDGSTVPLGRLRWQQSLPLAGGTLAATLDSTGSFGRRLNYFDLFPLGGPGELHGYLFQQFHGTAYTLAEAAYRRPLGNWRLLGERPQWALWYDVAGVRQPLEPWQTPQSGSAGVLLNSPLGVLTLAVGRTADGQTRGWINLGRP